MFFFNNYINKCIQDFWKSIGYKKAAKVHLKPHSYTISDVIVYTNAMLNSVRI